MSPMKLDALLRLERAVAGQKVALEAELAAARREASAKRQEASTLRQRAVLGQAGASAFEMRAHLAWQSRLIGAVRQADGAAAEAERLAEEISGRLSQALSREIALAKMIAATRRAQSKRREARSEDERRLLGKPAP